MKLNGIPAQSQAGCLPVLIVKIPRDVSGSEGTWGHRHLFLKTELIDAVPVIPALEFHTVFLATLKSETPPVRIQLNVKCCRVTCDLPQLCAVIKLIFKTTFLPQH